MHHAVVLYPSFDNPSVHDLRSRYDPSAASIAPHVTLLFPVPCPEGPADLIEHVAGAASHVTSFDLTFSGLHTSADHWLFLAVDRGADRCRLLHDRLYAGPYAEYRRPDLAYRPHLALGHFLRDPTRYDPFSPRPEHRDEERYEQGLRAAETLGPVSCPTVHALHVIAIPDRLLDWFLGAGGPYPAGDRVHDAGAVPLAGPPR